MRIAVTTSTFAEFSSEPLKLLEKAGFKFSLNPLGRKPTPAETVKQLEGCVGVVAGTETLDAEVLAALPDLKVISRCGTGMDSVDLEFAKSRGIIVVNTPYGPTRAVAELTLGLILNLLRQVSRMDRELRSGIWKKRMGRLLLGKKIGIVGMGRIGGAAANTLIPLGARIAYTDPDCEHRDFERMSLDKLLSWAEIISLHCSKPEGEKPLLGEAELSRMTPGSLLINAGRGGLVDEDALYKLLKSGHLSGAALDCFAEEPYVGPLSTLENVILTPHIGSYAMEGRVQMEVDAVKNLINAFGL